jgi:2-aminoethylphosphonate-pyruvate transaminase
MSSFGALAIDATSTPFDALIAASGKCIEGPPGMGFVIARKEALEASAGNCSSLALDLHDQWVYMEKKTQWRHTPLTNVVVAFDAALSNSSRKAASQRGLHATRATTRRWCLACVRALGSACFSTARSRRRSS